jgi:hypothetical protein
MTNPSRIKPTKLVVQYEDGSTREVDYAKVDGETRLRLAQMGLAPAGDRVGSAKNYLLMRWKDGWQEVLGVDKDPVELLRYYVIERIEDRGRLSLLTGEEYPELLVIERTPRDLVSALIVGADVATTAGPAVGGDKAVGRTAGGAVSAGVRSYALDTSVERWEGIFEAGGKREHVKFDKTSDEYPHEADTGTVAAAALRPVLDAVKVELEKAGLTATAVLAMDETERVSLYRAVASAAGIRGRSRQEDVYGFVEAMITRLGGAG